MWCVRIVWSSLKSLWCWSCWLYRAVPHRNALSSPWIVRSSATSCPSWRQIRRAEVSPSRISLWGRCTARTSSSPPTASQSLPCQSCVTDTSHSPPGTLRTPWFGSLHGYLIRSVTQLDHLWSPCKPCWRCFSPLWRSRFLLLNFLDRQALPKILPCGKSSASDTLQPLNPSHFVTLCTLQTAKVECSWGKDFLPAG